MGIYLGSTEVGGISLGDTSISMYLGEDEVYTDTTYVDLYDGQTILTNLNTALTNLSITKAKISQVKFTTEERITGGQVVMLSDTEKSYVLQNTETGTYYEWYFQIKKKTKYKLNGDCSSLFLAFTYLTELDLSMFDTSEVTNMSYMFQNCTKLTKLNIKGWNTSNVTNMAYMFYSDVALTDLVFSSFNTSNVTNMAYMFYYCNVVFYDLIMKLNTSKVTDMSYMFQGYQGSKLDVSNFDTSNVENMLCMFSNFMNTIELLDLSNFNTSKVTSFSKMFYRATYKETTSPLLTLRLDNFDFSSASSVASMFQGISTSSPSRIKTIYCNNTTIPETVMGSSAFSACTYLVGPNGDTYQTVGSTLSSTTAKALFTPTT